MNKLVVLSGVPGSGKSYFSKAIKKIKGSHVYVVSSDELRALIAGNQSSIEYEDLVWKMFIELAKTYSNDKEGIVILDATHISADLRVDRNMVLKDLFDEIDLVMWDLDKDLVNNQNLQREYPIPPDALAKFISMFEQPNEKDEAFFDKIIFVKDHNIASAIEIVLQDNQQGKLF